MSKLIVVFLSNDCSYRHIKCRHPHMHISLRRVVIREIVFQNCCTWTLRWAQTVVIRSSARNCIQSQGNTFIRATCWVVVAVGRRKASYWSSLSKPFMNDRKCSCSYYIGKSLPILWCLGMIPYVDEGYALFTRPPHWYRSMVEKVRLLPWYRSENRSRA